MHCSFLESAKLLGEVEGLHVFWLEWGPRFQFLFQCKNAGRNILLYDTIARDGHHLTVSVHFADWKKMDLHFKKH